ncbi:MAG: hypothetical protein RLN62_03865 [Rickettsiales bacterium]
MNLKTYNIASPLIMVSVFFALLPVVSGDYLRQDDWNAALWNGKNISDHVEYRNATFEMFRPVSMFIFYLTDMVSLHIEYAKYVRLINVLLIGLIGICLYSWGQKFNKNKIFNLCFSISSCTLPAFQIYAATANYCFMIITVLMSAISIHFLYRWYLKKNNQSKFYLIAGCVFFFISLMNYTLAAMFVWVMLMMLFINSKKELNNPNIRFLIHSSLIFIGLMLAYFLCAKFIHWGFNIKIVNPDRAVNISFDIMQKINYIFVVITLHTKLWLMRSYEISIVAPLIILSLFIASLKICLSGDKNGNYSNIFFSFFVTSFLFVLSFSPALAPSVGLVCFRYTVSTMPFILYILFWSICTVSVYFSKKITSNQEVILGVKNVILIIVTIFGIIISNISVSELIVGPQRYELNFIRQKIYNQALPALKDGKKVAIELIKDDGKSYVKPGLAGFEYGMTSSGFRGMFIGSMVYLMREIGFETNDKKVIPKWGEKQILLDDLPWGALFIRDYDVKKNKYIKQNWNKNYFNVTIDMRNIGPYR